MYVTLEPCFHDDTSPSCAKELLKTDIKNIVIGDIDIDPRTNGKSINYLTNNIFIFMVKILFKKKIFCYVKMTGQKITSRTIYYRNYYLQKKEIFLS